MITTRQHVQIGVNKSNGTAKYEANVSAAMRCYPGSIGRSVVVLAMNSKTNPRPIGAPMSDCGYNAALASFAA